MVYGYDEGILKIDDKTVYFTAKENDVFQKLYTSNRLVTYQELDDIINFGYGDNGIGYIRTVVARIRKKLGDSANIITVHNKGYELHIKND